MPHCPACQHEFAARSDAAVPYRCPRCAQLVLGPYCHLEWIGGGGMGDVYQAREPEMGDRTVAIKIPKTGYDADRAGRRFEREIAASARLEHENVVRAYHRGIEGGRPFLVMEFVDGLKLSDVVAREKTLSVHRTAAVLLGIARGLAHAGAMGIVNRDVKPENVLLARPSGTPKILDYGLALIGGGTDQVTRCGSLLGTPNYAAPEQARDPHGVTIAADVYSLGCTAVFCLTGRPPFPSDLVDEVLRLHAEAPRPSIRTRRPDAPDAMERLIRAMMAVDPGERPSPSRVVDALEALLAAGRLGEDGAVWLESTEGPPRQEEPVSAFPAEGKTDEAGGSRIDVECPECGTVYHLLAGTVGRAMQCPNKLCGATFVVGAPRPDSHGAIDAEIAAPAREGDEHGSGEAPGAPFEQSVPVPVSRAYLEAEIAESPPSDVEEIPASAIASDREPAVTESPVALTLAGAPAAAKPDTARPGATAAAPIRARRRESRKRRKVSRIAAGTVAAFVVGTALLLPYVPWDVLRPDAEARWAETMQRFDEKKWDRVVRELDEFEREFPDNAHVRELPFFRDLCRAGHDVYSPGGDAASGLAALERTFRDHRDNPAYAAYCPRLYDAVSRLVVRFVGRAIETSNSAGVESARRAHELLTTVGRAIDDDGIPRRTEALALAIEYAESALRVAAIRQAAADQIERAQAPHADVSADAIYAEIDRLIAQYGDVREELRDVSRRLRDSGEPALAALDELYVYYNRTGIERSIEATRRRLERAEKETDDGRIAAYGAEAARVEFVPQAPDGPPPGTDAEEPAPQGSLVVVVWGDEPGDVRLWNDWNHRRELLAGAPAAEPTEVVFALAQGILHAFDLQGNLLWARRLGIDSERLPRRLDTAVPISVAVSTEDNALIAVEEATGRVRWRYRVGQDVAAPLVVVERSVDAEGRARHCGLLPTADGEIHAIELVLGKPLGRFEVGHPLTVGGAYDARSGLVYFPADSKRIFAIDAAAVDDPERPACRAVLFTNHASGALRSEPAVVGRYLIVSEASELEHTRLRAFEIRDSIAFEPADPSRGEATLEGWTWFEPHCTPDRITLITDRGRLGVFGLNLDNPDEALYRIVPDWDTGRPGPYRALAVHAEEHLLWIMAGGLLEQLAVDVLHQQVHSLWKRSTAAAGLGGLPVHRAQTDRFAARLFLATASATGRAYHFTAVESESGRRVWQRQLGLNLLGDPVVADDGVMLVDRSGRVLTIRSDVPRAEGEPLPDGADAGAMMRLDSPSGSTHLVVPLDGGTRLAVREVGAAAPTSASWNQVALAVGDRINGRPCLAGDFLVVPCSDGQIRRIRWRGEGRTDGREISFGTGSTGRVDLTALADGAIVMVDGGRHLRRLEIRSEDGVTRWEPAGREFEPDGDARLCGEVLAVDDRLFLADTRGTWYCLDVRDPGRRLAVWPLQARVTCGPALRGSHLVAVSDQRRLICLDLDAPPDAAQPRWITDPLEGRIRGLPVLAGDTLWVADNSRRLTGIRLSDGKAAWSVRLRARVGPSATPVPCHRDKMLVPLSDGTLLVMHVPSPDSEEVEP